MGVEQAINDISALPVNDQLRIIHALWDGLPAAVATDLSDSQRQELDRRWAAYQANPSLALTEQEFRQQVRDSKE